MEVVAHPDHVEPDVLPARTRLYRRDVGPEPMAPGAVVSFEQQPIGAGFRRPFVVAETLAGLLVACNGAGLFGSSDERG